MNLFNKIQPLPYITTTGDKVYPVVVDIKKGITKSDSISFMSADNNTGVLVVSLFDGQDEYVTTGATVVCNILRPDGSDLHIPCILSGTNTLEIQLGVDGTIQVGLHTFDIWITRNNKVTSTPVMGYTVGESIQATGIESDDRVPILTTLITEVDTTLNEANVKINETVKATGNAVVATNNANKVVIEATNTLSEINKAIVSGTQDLEVKVARGESASLREELERIETNAKVVTETVEGSFVTVQNAVAGSISNIQIFGNTVQGTDLSDIKSAGIKRSDGTVEMSISCTGKNLFDGVLEIGALKTNDGLEDNSATTWRRSSYIKVRKSMQLVHSSNNTQSKYIFMYDKDKNFIRNVSTTTLNQIITLDSSCCYIRLCYREYNATWIQLEEGTVATQYEPCQHSKSTISLPVQLGNGDRLYYCKDEKAWCIDKYEDDMILNGTEQWANNINRYTFYSNKFKRNSIMSSVKTVDWSEMISGSSMSIACSGDAIGISSDFATSVSELKAKLQATNMVVRGTCNSIVRKIILPLDQQLKLNSLYGTNHLFIESGEAQATFKATVPKSLAGSVQSLQTKTDILEEEVNAIQGLKESQNMDYEMGNGYLTCQSTNDGSVKDMVVHGRTLNNLCERKPFTYSEIYPNREFLGWRMLKPNTKYTFKLFGDFSNARDILISDGSLSEQVLPRGNYGTTFTFTTPSNLSTFSKNQKIYCYKSSETSLTESQVSGWNILILEGDHTQNPPSYFEGLKSFGEDVDVVEVSSVKSDGNLFDETIFAKYGFDNEEGIQINSLVNKEVIEIFEKNAQYTISFSYDRAGAESSLLLRVEYIDGSLSLYISDTMKHVTNPNKTIKRIFFTYGVSGIAKNIKVNITKGDSYKEYEPRVLSKKHLAFYNEQNQITKINKNTPLRQWDIFDSKKGTVTFASNQEVLNGSENWVTQINTQTDVISFRVATDKKLQGTNNIVCNKFNTVPNVWNENVEGISGSLTSDNVVISVQRAKLTTQDVTGFKAWLQANPVTVAYQVATPKTYEIVDPTLDSYDNETTVSINAGAINTKVEFAITSHINNFAKHLNDRFNKFQDKVMDIFKSWLSGGAQALAFELYPEDFNK